MTAPPFSIVDEFGDEDVAKLRRLRRDEVYPNVGPVVSEVLVPGDVLFRLSYDTLVWSLGLCSLRIMHVLIDGF